MKVRWSFYRFDYVRFQDLRPLLRTAETVEDFQSLPANEETEVLMESLAMQEMRPEEVRAEYVLALCCKGEPLNLDRSFTRCVSLLSFNEDSEEGTDLFSALLSHWKNMEVWMLPSRTLRGFLTPEETIKLYIACIPSAKQARLHRTGKRRRRKSIGGLVGKGLRFFRQLLDREPLTEEMWELFRDLLESAVHRGEGIALVTL